jgi:hypothetical protein
MQEKASSDLEPPGRGRTLAALDADRRHETQQREFALLQKMQERLNTLEAEVVELRTRIHPESWRDYHGLADLFSVGHRTVQKWRQDEGMPMEELDGKCKGLLSDIVPWMAANGKGAYLRAPGLQAHP